MPCCSSESIRWHPTSRRLSRMAGPEAVTTDREITEPGGCCSTLEDARDISAPQRSAPGPFPGPCNRAEQRIAPVAQLRPGNPAVKGRDRIGLRAPASSKTDQLAFAILVGLRRSDEQHRALRSEGDVP